MFSARQQSEKEIVGIISKEIKGSYFIKQICYVSKF